MSGGGRHFWLVLPLLFACDGWAGSPIAEDVEGRFQLELVAPAERTVDDEGQLWVVSDGTLRVTAQVVQADDQVLRGRTARQVAEAITTRFELGDVEGTMSRAACDVGGIEAECLVGWIVGSDGVRYARRGAVIPVGDELVVVHANARMAEGDAVERQHALLRRSFQGSGG